MVKQIFNTNPAYGLRRGCSPKKAAVIGSYLRASHFAAILSFKVGGRYDSSYVAEETSPCEPRSL